ncbi:MAG TPA: ABC transporter permease [Gammaproteobacteria bacterium]
MDTRLGRWLTGFVWHPRWLAFAVLIAAWQVTATVRDSRVLPGPGRVWDEFWAILSTFAFVDDLWASMVRILAGFSVAMLVGIVAGILMGSRRSWDDFLRDLVVFGLALPGLVYALIAVMLFGQALWAPILAITLTSYPFVAVNVREGVSAIDKQLLELASIYRVSRWVLVRRIIIPSLLPFIFAGLRLGFSIAWKVNTLVEVFGSTDGVGWQIRASFDAYSVHGMLAWTFIFGGAMLFIEYYILTPVERYFSRWRPKIDRVV